MDKPTPPKIITTRMLGTGPAVEFVFFTDAIAHGEAMAAWGAAQYKEDAERLDYVLRRLPGSILRSLIGTMSDTGDINEFRAAIDKARGK